MILSKKVHNLVFIKFFINKYKYCTQTKLCTFFDFFDIII